MSQNLSIWLKTNQEFSLSRFSMRTASSPATATPAAQPLTASWASSSWPMRHSTSGPTFFPPGTADKCYFCYNASPVLKFINLCLLPRMCFWWTDTPQWAVTFSCFCRQVAWLVQEVTAQQPSRIITLSITSQEGLPTAYLVTWSQLLHLVWFWISSYQTRFSKFLTAVKQGASAFITIIL